MNEREAFLQAIAANEDDVLVRLVFADWLDEHGEHEEAERQRALPEAKRWLNTICKEYNANCGEDSKLNCDQLLQFGRSVSAMPGVHVSMEWLVGDFPSGNIVHAIRDRIPDFCKAWSIVTGAPLAPDIERKYYYESGYCCQNEIYPDTHLAGPVPEEVLRAQEEAAQMRRFMEELEEDERDLRREAEEEFRQAEFDMIQDELDKDRP